MLSHQKGYNIAIGAQMDNLIKNLKLIKSIIADEEVVKFDQNGQWSLEKAWVKDEKLSTPAKNLKESNPTLSHAFYGTGLPYKSDEGREKHQHNAIAIEDMHNMSKQAAQNGDHNDAQKFKDQIREHIMNADEGTIDFDHLDGLGIDIQDDYIRKHLGGAKDMLDVYNRGGERAVKSILDLHGANGIPAEYHDVELKNPELHNEAMNLVNPGKGAWERKWQMMQKERDKHIAQNGKFKDWAEEIKWRDKVEEDLKNAGAYQDLDKYEDLWEQFEDDDDHKETLETYDKMFDSPDGFDEEMAKKHGQAAKRRAMKMFKAAHGL
jgi:hypothetical protein